MADDFMKPSLLPPPLATDLSMRALEAVQSRLSDIDLLPTLIYDFERNVASALPASGRTVSRHWRGRLADCSDRRAAPRAARRAVALHRHKGTPWAIREALKSVGFNDLEIDERFARPTAMTVPRFQRLGRVCRLWLGAISRHSRCRR